MLWKNSCAITLVAGILASAQANAETLDEQQTKFFATFKKVHDVSDKDMKAVKEIFAKSRVMSQGNPKVTKHPFTRDECKAKLKKLKVNHDNDSFEEICGDKYMAPLYDPEKEKATDANVCIDQFEFPSIPCEYPVVWVRADEAAQICNAIGKRMCDAHEWEGACEGQLLEADYPFDKVKGMSGANAFRAMRSMHNKKWAPKKRWAYGTPRKTGVCAMNSTKSTGCNGGDWKKCGTNTYPTGMFPDCSNDLKVYDINGNAAEHMNLPTNPTEVASTDKSKLGHTEMKGSWFIWDKFQAHQDWCRWRAPYWHGTKVMSDHSHHNYHLGFRCCKDLSAKTKKSSQPSSTPEKK